MLRITGGELRNRRLAVPKGEDVIRPTSDRVRQALFNILGAKRRPSEDDVVLDVFCGTGALGIEAISRGAHTAIFLDRAPEALSLVKTNIETLQLGHCTQVIRCDLPKVKPRSDGISAASLVFLDPPYRKNLIAPTLTALAAHHWLADDALIVAETAEGETFTLPAGFARSDERTYGGTALSFLTFHQSIFDDSNR